MNRLVGILEHLGDRIAADPGLWIFLLGINVCIAEHFPYMFGNDEREESDEDDGFSRRECFGEAQGSLCPCRYSSSPGQYLIVERDLAVHPCCSLTPHGGYVSHSSRHS